MHQDARLVHRAARLASVAAETVPRQMDCRGQADVPARQDGPAEPDAYCEPALPATHEVDGCGARGARTGKADTVCSAAMQVPLAAHHVAFWCEARLHTIEAGDGHREYPERTQSSMLAVHLVQVLMIWDNVRSAGPGGYGLGLAAALGETRWLPHMTGPIVFRCVTPTV